MVRCPQRLDRLCLPLDLVLSYNVLFASRGAGVALLDASACLMVIAVGLWFVWHGCFQVNAMGV
jgi:hypothetical protein